MAGQDECPDCDAGGNAECCPKPITGACCDPITFTCTEVAEGNCPQGSDFYPDQGCGDIDCTAPPPKGACCCPCSDTADEIVFGQYTGQVTRDVCVAGGCRWSLIINDAIMSRNASAPPPPPPPPPPVPLVDVVR